ncbi:MAG TPA: UbiA family prenyltransferase [Nitrososphaerales archaeon]|nr:UbiA family prenyltransferase [Nitrososphaerales archaeon]
MEIVTSNRAIRELVYGGHLLAVGTASIAASSAILLGRSPSVVLLVMAYLFSYGAYMLNRGAEVTQDSISDPRRTSFLQGRSRYLKLISAASFAAGYVLAATVGLVFFLALLAPLILAIAYTVGSKKMVRIIGAKRLKDKLLVKNIVISFGWSLIPLLVGLYYRSIPAALAAFVPFIFFRLMSNTVFFDLRDVRADRDFGVRTAPVVFGSTFSYRLMTLFDLASAVYLSLLVVAHIFPIYSLVMLSLPVYSLVYRWISQKPGSDLGLLCNFVADGEYLLWGPILLFGKII